MPYKLREDNNACQRRWKRKHKDKVKAEKKKERQKHKSKYKKWDKDYRDRLSEGYCRKKLLEKGIKKEVIEKHPEIILAQKIMILVKRKIWAQEIK